MGNFIVGLIALVVIVAVLCGIVALGGLLIAYLGPVMGIIAIVILLNINLN